MDKEIWTWILHHIPDEQLVHISKKLKIKIPGFRESNYQKNMALIKDRLIQQATTTKNILKIKGEINQWCNEQDQWLIYRNKKIDFLYEYVSIEKSKTVAVLASLLSSSYHDQYLAGVALYDQLKQSNMLPELGQAFLSFENTEDKIKMLEEKISKYVSSLEEKTQTLESKEKRIHSLTELQKSQKQSLEKLQQELDDVKQMLDVTMKASSQKDTIIDDKQSVISTLEEENSKLKDQLELAKATLLSYKEAASSLSPPLPNQNQEKKSILLIGNRPRKVIDKLQSHGFSVTICNDLSSIKTNCDCDYIWLIEYQVSFKLKRDIQKILGFEKMICIQDHNELVKLTDELLERKI
ncbi:hypothetical protein [Risungbinella massiliensis]|uniref:hypothetical protein n=1 Tax=Risungbinella massiliensis TaxID=1329796 RepID=UPI0005CC1850|nr:hypothetical protein [Risungbinella massiliensis]